MSSRKPHISQLRTTRAEVQIRMEIRRVLELHGYVVLDLEQGYRRDGTTRVRKGLPDLYVMGAGRSAWIEVKSARGRQTPSQRAFQADCHTAGIEYHLWRTPEEALRWATAAPSTPTVD